jgi:hypothetical protein
MFTTLMDQKSVSGSRKTTSVQDYKSTIDITSDLTLKYKFNHALLPEFWGSFLQKSSKLSKYAVFTLLPFTTMYLCEVGFS